MTQSIIRKLPERGYAVAAGSVAIATAVFLPGRNVFAKGQWAIFYLLLVVFVAGIYGVRPAILTAALSFAAWDFFFIPPYGTFEVGDPKDWLSLVAFLAVGSAMGLQTGRMREQEAQALSMEHDTQLLNDLSSDLVAQRSVDGMAAVLAGRITEVVGASGVQLLVLTANGTLAPAGPEAGVAYSLNLAEWSLRNAKAVGLIHAIDMPEPRPERWPVSASPADVPTDATPGGLYLPLQGTERCEGILFVSERPDNRPYGPHDARMLVAIANLAAAFLERQRLQEDAARALAVIEADRLKSALVSSVSHELRTPLAALRAVVSGLQDADVPWDPDLLRQELDSMGDAIQRLEGSIGSLLDLSRLDAGAWQPKRERYELGEILGTVLARIPKGQRSRVRVSVPSNLPPIYVDFVQWSRALQHLVENALAYSPPDSPVAIGASAGPDAVTMWVEDRGPGISPEEKRRIFQRFERGAAAAARPSGTGLGLAVAKEIVRHHGGSIWIEDPPPCGARFVIALPNTDTNGDVNG